MNKSCMIAMSGGVDSSVAAAILKNEGMKIAGVTLKLYREGEENTETSCCSSQDIEDARKVAKLLGMDYEVLNFSADFENYVVKYFADTYLCGGTPNPCVECNRNIKFPEILKYAEKKGFTHIATGHYARVEYDGGSKRFLLKKAVDLSKEQSYVLYSLTQKQLEHILFPLGNLTKDEVRKIASEMELCTANKKDSQDICFVKGKDYGEFIEDYTGIKRVPGDFVDMAGNVIGQHNGIINYTIGQRRGLGLSMNRHVFVVSKDIIKNTVTIGDETDLYTKRLTAKNINLIACDKINASLSVTAKTRYSQKEAPAVVFQTDDNTMVVEFKEPQRAITRGQSVVLYDGDVVVGGGIID